MSELAALLSRHCRQDVTTSAVPRLTLMRSTRTTQGVPVLAQPQFCVIAAGRKRVFLGSEPFDYDPTSYLITSADLPVAGQVLEAPYYGFSLAIEPATLAELLLTMQVNSQVAGTSRALAVTPLDRALLDAVLRLLRLLDEPRHIAVLAPLIEREILYHLLLGCHGGMLRQLAAPGSPLSQIRRAAEWLQRNYDRPAKVAEAARIAGMSEASFHRHFRAVTAMSPLQFLKRIRLHEARRRLLVENVGSAIVAFDVGYQSPSQFSREYRRMFGSPPAQDAARGRRTLSPSGSTR